MFNRRFVGNVLAGIRDRQQGSIVASRRCGGVNGVGRGQARERRLFLVYRILVLPIPKIRGFKCSMREPERECFVGERITEKRGLMGIRPVYVSASPVFPQAIVQSRWESVCWRRWNDHYARVRRVSIIIFYKHFYAQDFS